MLNYHLLRLDKALFVLHQSHSMPCGSHGLMIEAQYKNETALTDREQALSVSQYKNLIEELNMAR